MKALLMVILLLPLQLPAQEARAANYRIGNAVQECRGRGLCDLSWSDDGTESRSQAGKLSASTFLLKISRQALSEADEINIVGKPLKEILPGETLYFNQPNELLLNGESLKGLKMSSESNSIAAGNYPLFVSPDYIEITFTLTRSK